MCLHLVHRFLRDRKGALPVIFALTIIPGIALVGMAVDFAGAQGVKARLQAAADAAVLEAVTQSERLELEAGNETDFVKKDTSYPPIQRASDLFRSMTDNGAAGAKNVQHGLTVQRKGNIFTARITYSGEYATTMPNVAKMAALVLEGGSESSVAVSGSGYLDIFTLLDTSSSMGVGASPSDIAKLESWKEGPNYDAKKKKGCAFSCHGEKPAGVQLRIDVMRDAVIDMIKSAEAEFKKQDKGEAARIRIAINKFDHEPKQVEAMTSDYSRLTSDVNEIRLHPTQHRGTDMKRAINWLAPNVPKSGNGQSASDPRRFVFIVTDGMQDRHPAWQAVNFPGPYGADGRTGGVDPAACNVLKSKGVTVAILYTTHVGIKDYEWYWQKSQPAIRPNLKACASDNYFFEASDAAQLSAEFKKMFKKAVQASSARISQ